MLTTRFVYPQFSLEGPRLWIIGMAPMGLARIVKAKYWLASCASLVMMLALVGLSSHLLRIPWDHVVFFGAVITVMAFSLNGLASGLGVLYPNLKEGNPSKIVSGFGGTLCLMLSFLYILASVLLLALGCWETREEPPPQWLSLNCIAAFIVLSFALGWLPFKFALKRLRDFEF
jgi:ABC-2 type transport system permease protein